MLTSRAETAALVTVLLAAVALLPFFYVGYQASDDASYVAGAMGWIEQFPYVGNSHWTLRHTITLPVAAAVTLLGLNELAVSLPATIYFVLFVALNTVAATRVLGGGAAVVAGLLTVTLPGFLVIATYLSPDIPELFFVSLAFWAFVFGCRRPEAIAPWLICGVAWSLAFLNRQTALGFPLFLGLLFVFKPVVPRSRYFLIAAAALPILVGEAAYLHHYTDNWLYRYRIDYTHDAIDRAAQVAATRARQGIIDGEGNLAINQYLDPFLSLLVSQKYVFTFWLALVGGWALWKHRHALGDTGEPLALIGAFALVYFLFVGFNPRLYLVPRYLVVVAWAASLVAGYWIVTLWRGGRRRTAAALIALPLAANFAALMIENTNPRFAERELAAWVAENPGREIHADAETKFRADYFFQFRGVTGESVSSAAPRPGATVFYSPDGMRRCAASPRCRDDAGKFEPTQTWREVARTLPPERVLVRVLRAIGLDRALPEDLARRLVRPVSPIVIYQVEA